MGMDIGFGVGSPATGTACVGGGLAGGVGSRAGTVLGGCGSGCSLRGKGGIGGNGSRAGTVLGGCGGGPFQGGSAEPAGSTHDQLRSGRSIQTYGLADHAQILFAVP